MAKKLISVLGTGNYSNCVYYTKDSEHESKYIQESILNIECKDWSKEDKLVIVLTKGAREKHWESLGGLKERVSNINVGLQEVSIPDGKNEDELWGIFQGIYDAIEDNDEIYLDITHSFRTIPMFLLIILNYAQVLKNIKVCGIQYGAYEARETRNEVEYAPIIDLLAFNNLLQWTKGIDTFIKVGSAKDLADFTEQVNKQALKNKNKSFLSVNKAVKQLDVFTNNINTCRGGILPEKEYRRSVNASYKKLIKSIDEISTTDNKGITPLIPLFNKVKERTASFENNDLLSTGIATVQWSIDNNLIQQGYTVLEETIKTYMCLKYNLDTNDIKAREGIAKKALTLYNKSEENWKVEDENKEKVKEIVSDVNVELVNIAQKIGEKRNDINHNAMNKAASSSDNLCKYLTECFAEFLRIIEWEK